MLSKFKWGAALLVGALLALVGCQNEKVVDDSGSQTTQTVTLIAKHAGGSRTVINPDGSTSWR